MSWRHRRRKRRRPLTGRKRKCPICKVAKYPADWARGDFIDGHGYVESRCKACMTAKKGELVYIAPELPITQRVQKRLWRRASKDVRKPLREYFISPPYFSIVVVVGFAWLILDYYNIDWQIGITLIAWVIYGNVVSYFVDWCKEPRRERQHTRVVELATFRQQQIHEAKQFYASAEWRSIRNTVISEEGPHCYLCNQAIVDPNEIAVDHVKPRSSYPELALIRENLRVACRSCNSNKGARYTA